MKSEQIIAAIKHDHWSLVKGADGEAKLLMRFREGLSEATDFSEYPKVLRISWKFVHDGSSGMPSEKDSREMEEFENYLVEALESDFHAALTAVVTENGVREWIFYTSDLSECSRRINQMPQKTIRYPIELVSNDDVDWSYFRNTFQTICSNAA